MFSKKPTAISHASLLEKKNRILGVFTSMQKELQDLHDEQLGHAQNLQSQLKALSEELTLVESSRAETTKTITNIDKILK